MCELCCGDNQLDVMPQSGRFWIGSGSVGGGVLQGPTGRPMTAGKGSGLRLQRQPLPYQRDVRVYDAWLWTPMCP